MSPYVIEPFLFLLLMIVGEEGRKTYEYVQYINTCYYKFIVAVDATTANNQLF